MAIALATHPLGAIATSRLQDPDFTIPMGLVPTQIPAAHSTRTNLARTDSTMTARALNLTRLNQHPLKTPTPQKPTPTLKRLLVLGGDRPSKMGFATAKEQAPALIPTVLLAHLRPAPIPQLKPRRAMPQLTPLTPLPAILDLPILLLGLALALSLTSATLIGVAATSVKKISPGAT